jgi:hypothetical protein
MKRTLWSSILLASSLTAPAWAGTNVGITVNIGDAPPPPVIAVRSEPRLVYVSDARCWVVADDRWQDDCFKHGSHWYTYHDGWWYRSKSWRGPYRVIEERYVPVAVHRVPARHWRHEPRFTHARHVKYREKHYRSHHGRGHDHDHDHRADAGGHRRPQ